MQAAELLQVQLNKHNSIFNIHSFQSNTGTQKFKQYPNAVYSYIANLFTAYCLLLTVYCLLFTVYCLLYSYYYPLILIFKQFIK